MSDVATRTIEFLQEELETYKDKVREIEAMIKAVRAASVSPPSRTVRKKAVTRSVRTTRRTRKGSYVSLAEDVLRKAGQPMRMVDLITQIAKLKPGGGRYASSAARQAITNAATSAKSNIVRVGPKGSGTYGLVA